MAALAAGALAVTVSAPAASAAAPSFVRTLGGPGHAELYPSGMEVGPGGVVVVADTGNDAVAKYSAAGVRQWRVTQAGDGSSLENARDIAIDANGNIYVADDGNARVVKLSPAGVPIGQPWKGPDADKIGGPIGITEKNGLIYIADGLRKKVRVFRSDGTQVRSFGSDGACSLAALRDVDADSSGNIYVANYTNNDILKFTATGSCITKWGTKGDANGQFRNPYGVRVARDPVWGESVYVADSNANRVQIFSRTGTWLASVGQSGSPTTPGTFTTMRRVAVGPGGDVWGADLWGARAVRFDRTSTGFSYAQTIGNGLAPLQPNALFNEVRAVAFSSDGTLNAVDTVNQRVVRLSQTGSVLGSCGLRTNAPVSPNWPRGVAVDPVTGDRWVADTKQNRLQVWRNDCTVVARFGGPGTALGNFDWPHAVAIRASDRTAFVADTKNDRIVAYDVATRTPLRAYGTLGAGTGQFFEPRGLSVAPDGSLLVADTRNDRVVRLGFTRSGGFTWSGVLRSGLNDPEGVAQDATGRVWIADTLANRVVLVPPGGGATSVISSANGKAFAGPSSVTVNGGKAYVSDTQNDRIAVFTAG